MIKKQYPANKPELKKKVKLQFSLVAAISVQVTISRVSISILKETPKSKIRLAWGPLCSQGSPLYIFFLFFFKGARKNSYVQPLHLYSLTISDRKFHRKVYSLRTDMIGNQTITFFATHNYNPIFELPKLCGSCSVHVQGIAEKCAVAYS